MIHDHFSAVADAYARYRPHYPGALFEWIANNAPSRELAWDCGCGNGQATLALAGQFQRVIATDASAAQIAKAPRRPNIDWRVAPAEASGLEGASADAITVAQALHWFDLPRFWREVRRVGRPGALIAVFSYGVQRTGDAAIDAALHDHHYGLLGPYWPPERVMVDEGYRSIEFPFERIAVPEIPMIEEWSLDQMLGFTSSWSGTRRYVEARGQDPNPELQRRLEPLWGPGTRRVAWPLAILAGRVGPESP